MRNILFTIALALLAVTAANAQKAVKYNQYGVAVESDVLDVEAQDGILVMESPKSGYKLWFDIRAQADAAVFFGAPDYADAIGNGTQIRRARFAVKGQINRDWYGEFDMDLANGLAELKDAIVRYTGVPNLDLQVGNFKENFSIQRNTTSRYLQFIERPMVCSALTPSRHLGFNAKYAKDWLWVSAGAFSQVIAGQEEWTNVADNNKDLGRSSGYSLTTKVVFRPLYKMDNASLHIGAAYSYRTTTTDLATGEWGTYRASCRNSTSINRKKYVDTNNLPGFDHNNLWTVELAGHWNGLRYEAAYVGDNVHFKSDAADPTTKNFGGWYVELCARYENVDLNDGNVYGGAAEAYTLGLNWHVNNNVKLVVNYQYNNNDRYANGKGKLFVGNDATTGKPTKDFTKIADKKAGVDYHMLCVRFEIDF